jgi:hypothetical protein
MSMNQVYDCGYTHSEAEFEEMLELLVNSYATSTKLNHPPTG